MQNSNKLALFLAIEGYKNGDLTEDLMRTAVDAYSKSIIEPNELKECISENGLIEKNERSYLIGKGLVTVASKANLCIEIAKQYSDSKLSELEKWIDEQFKHADSLDKQDDSVTRYFSGKKDGLSLIKIKIQSLKQ